MLAHVQALTGKLLGILTQGKQKAGKQEAG